MQIYLTRILKPAAAAPARVQQQIPVQRVAAAAAAEPAAAEPAAAEAVVVDSDLGADEAISKLQLLTLYCVETRCHRMYAFSDL